LDAARALLDSALAIIDQFCRKITTLTIKLLTWPKAGKPAVPASHSTCEFVRLKVNSLKQLKLIPKSLRLVASSRLLSSIINQLN